MVKIQVSLAPGLHDLLSQWAESEGHCVSSLARELLHAAIRNRNDRHQADFP